MDVPPIDRVRVFNFKSSQGNTMISTLFLKKLFYFFTTGTLLFYIVSVETAVNASSEEMAKEELVQCQQSVRKLNSGKPFTLKEKYQVSYKNILRLTIAEQKAINFYLKEMKTSLVQKGQSNPMRVSAYKFENKTNSVLGYKVVVQSWDLSTEEGTVFLDKDANVLFAHVDSLVPLKSWVCEKDN